MPLPTPHLEKLQALLENEKLPTVDRARVQSAAERYGDWIRGMTHLGCPPEERVGRMVSMLAEYKTFIDVDLIFDSPADFLYRQKGQLKLDNSIIEEFLPWVVSRALGDALPTDVGMGAQTCFSAVYFTSTLTKPTAGGGLAVRQKDQDFAVTRRLFIRTSHTANFAKAEEAETRVGYVTAEVKTNLDKTMFQEAAATAHDVKTAVAGARYYLLCEWLDMTPISTGTTDIDEVLLLRGAKRLGSGIRENFATSAGRRRLRGEYVSHLSDHPFRPDVFDRFVGHVRELLTDREPVEAEVLKQGHF